MSNKQWFIMALVVIGGFILGRLAVRMFLNMMLGGTMFGGNFL